MALGITLLLSGLSVAFALIFALRRRQNNQGSPPGPAGVPLLGNALQTSRDVSKVHLTMAKWKEEFGSVFKIRMFGNDLVVVSGRDAIHEVR